MTMSTVKATEIEWELEVLGVPYGGPYGGKDAAGEYFSPQTNLREDLFPLPRPVVYYHGFNPDGSPQGSPELIGRAVSAERRNDGVWYRVVLDKSKELARRVWQAALDGLARASSGAVAHLTRTAPDGQIQEWGVAELSLFDVGPNRRPANPYAVVLPATKAICDAANLPWPALPEAVTKGKKQSVTATAKQSKVTITKEECEAMSDKQTEPKPVADAPVEVVMTEAELQERVQKEVQAALAAREKAAAEAAKAEREQQEIVEEAVKAARKQWEAERNRLPGGMPYVAHYNPAWKYDHLGVGDLALTIAVLSAARRAGDSRQGVNDAARKALAIRLLESKEPADAYARRAMKAAGIAVKADEIMQTDLTSYGDEWVGAAYSNQLWQEIRMATQIVNQIPSIEVPPGYESITIPLEGDDPTFYKVAQAADTATSGWPNATITSSQAGTDSQTLSLVKMGARVLWTGEMEEDSLVPFIAQLRAQLVSAGAEYLEHAVIDGDTATGATTNINDIGGTPGGTEAFLLVNGFRKLALVTNTANSRDGGALTVEDFLETVKLMGVGGKVGFDRRRTALILDPNVHWKALELDEVQTKDTFSMPTLEGGMLTGLWGYPVYVSYNMHRSSLANTGYEYKTNTAGKIDLDTPSNNTVGAILAVRFDRWRFGWRRRMTLETTRIARADTTEIVALMRFGLVNRDNEAAAISYNITV